MRAVYRKDETELLSELASGADINVADADGRTPLMHAVLAADAEVSWVRTLLQLGARTEMADRGQGWTALHFAARDQKAEIVKLLLEEGAPVDARDGLGHTPLWRATMSRSPNRLLIKELLDRGADPDAANRDGVSPRKLAARLGHTFLF